MTLIKGHSPTNINILLDVVLKIIISTKNRTLIIFI